MENEIQKLLEDNPIDKNLLLESIVHHNTAIAHNSIDDNGKVKMRLIQPLTKEWWDAVQKIEDEKNFT